MKQTQLIMGMPITIEVADARAPADIFERVFGYFTAIDRTFSTYKPNSEISRINNREITIEQASQDMRTIVALAEQTRRETNGYFDIARGGAYYPCGIGKVWGVYQGAHIMRGTGCRNFYVDAGRAIQGVDRNGQSRR